MEERVSDCETMKRENRRVAAMSWGGDDTPPPKPTRVPQTDSVSMLSLGESSSIPQTYIIAQNAAVLAQLMRENENRPLNPSAYTTPASVFNTLAVDIDASKPDPITSESPVLPLKTVILPACEMLKLNQMIENAHESDTIPTNILNPNDQTKTKPSQNQLQLTDINSQAPHMYPCNIINTLSQQIQKLQTADVCDNSIVSQNPPLRTGDFGLKSRSLERNLQSNTTYASRISSLDRCQNTNAQLKQMRSNSLTRHMNSVEDEPVCTNSFVSSSIRSGSLERGAKTAASIFRVESLESYNGQNMSPQYAQFINTDMQHWGSLERNPLLNTAQNIIMTTGKSSYGSLECSKQGTLVFGLSLTAKPYYAHFVFFWHVKAVRKI